MRIMWGIEAGLFTGILSLLFLAFEWAARRPNARPSKKLRKLFARNETTSRVLNACVRGLLFALLLQPFFGSCEALLRKFGFVVATRTQDAYPMVAVHWVVDLCGLIVRALFTLPVSDVDALSKWFGLWGTVLTIGWIAGTKFLGLFGAQGRKDRKDRKAKKKVQNAEAL